jgi:hypothetical protein
VGQERLPVQVQHHVLNVQQERFPVQAQDHVLSVRQENSLELEVRLFAPTVLPAHTRPPPGPVLVLHAMLANPRSLLEPVPSPSA